MNITFLTTDFDVNQLIRKIAQFNLSKSLNDGLYTDRLKRLKNSTPEQLFRIPLPLRSNLLIYENLLYYNVICCLMTPTRCWKISGLWQEEIMLHGKYLYSDLIFPFCFFFETQNYLMDCNIPYFFSLVSNYSHCHAQGFSKSVFSWTWKIFMGINCKILSNIYPSVFYQNR